MNDFMTWMERTNLYTLAKNHSKHFKYILKSLVKAKPKQPILIIGDFGSYNRRVAPLLACSYYLAAKHLKLDTKLVIQSPKLKTESADPHVIQNLAKQPNNGIIILNTSNKLGKLPNQKTLRKIAREKRNKFITTTGLGNLETKDIYLLTRAFDIDYNKMMTKAKRLKAKLDKARKIRIITGKGTDFEAEITGNSAISIDGNFSDKLGGNMPAGEVYIAPKPKTLNGTIVIDGSSRNSEGTSIVEKPITIIVKKGMIYKIIGNKEADLLKQSLYNARDAADGSLNPLKIGEIGIGLNPNINIIGSMVVDEKAENTAHIGIGSNHWFGGENKTNIHLDQVFRNPIIEIDGERIKI